MKLPWRKGSSFSIEHFDTGTFYGHIVLSPEGWKWFVTLTKPDVLQFTGTMPSAEAARDAVETLVALLTEAHATGAEPNAALTARFLAEQGYGPKAIQRMLGAAAPIDTEKLKCASCTHTYFDHGDGTRGCDHRNHGAADECGCMSFEYPERDLTPRLNPKE